MLKKVGIALSAFTALALQFSTANALTYTTNLIDHPNGSAAPPSYGLRLDGLFDGEKNDTYTFSFDGVTMTTDTEEQTVLISGDLIGGFDADERDGSREDDTWSFSFLYDTNITVNGDGSWAVDGSSSGANFGTLTYTGSNNVDGKDDDVDTGKTIGLSDFMGGSFEDDDHRCGSDCGPWVGIGWLSHTTNFDSTEYTHYDYNDFLYTAADETGPNITSVPEPSAFGSVKSRFSRSGSFASS